MLVFRTVVKILIAAILVVGAGFFVITNWSWVFSKRVQGVIVSVERVTEPAESQLHSFSILIRDKQGKLYTSDTEDRQWQVAKPGYCVDALLYRYPPWHLERANTFFNARIKELSECEGTPTEQAPQEEVPQEETQSPE